MNSQYKGNDFFTPLKKNIFQIRVEKLWSCLWHDVENYKGHTLQEMGYIQTLVITYIIVLNLSSEIASTTTTKSTGGKNANLFSFFLKKKNMMQRKLYSISTLIHLQQGVVNEKLNN